MELLILVITIVHLLFTLSLLLAAMLVLGLLPAGMTYVSTKILAVSSKKRKQRETLESHRKAKAKAEAEAVAAREKHCRENPDDDGCDEYGWMA